MPCVRKRSTHFNTATKVAFESPCLASELCINRDHFTWNKFTPHGTSASRYDGTPPHGTSASGIMLHLHMAQVPAG
jgi:hypothetical protein